MTDEEAEKMLKELSKHYKQPVMPVKKYCEALYIWARVIREKYEKENGGGRFNNTKALLDSINKVQLAIQKSNLLYRLIYCGQKLRTKICPKHGGIWSGLPSPDNDCEYGCDFTGWIPDDFVPQKPGDPCRHKWRGTSVVDGKRYIECWHCKEDITNLEKR